MKIWTAVYHHRHGVNVYLFANQEPTEEQVIAEIARRGEEFEPDREDEFIDIAGPETLCTDEVGEKIDGVFVSSEKKRQYIDDQHCPFCGVGGCTIGVGEADWNDDRVIQGVKCENCDKEWDDFYQLLNIMPS